MNNIIIIGAFPENASFIKGGVQASVYGLAKALKARTDVSSVRVIALPVKGSPRHSSTRNVEGINVFYLKSYAFLAMGILNLPAILREIRTDNIVHIHGTGLVQAALLAVLRIRKIKCIWTLHGITAKETLQRFRSDKNISALARHILYRLLERFSIAIAPHIIVDTPYVAQELGMISRICVIPQGIFSEEFSGMQNTLRDKPVILSVGVIAPRKGHHHTIEAFARVHTHIQQSRLIIVGSVTDAAYYQQLKKQIAGLGLCGNIELVVDLPRETIMKLFAEAKMFALHSQEESQSIALCEALAAGLPVIATAVGGIPFVVTDRQDGLLVGYGDIHGFTDSMLRLLENTALYEQMAEAAKSSARRFDWKNIADEVINIYGKI